MMDTVPWREIRLSTKYRKSQAPVYSLHPKIKTTLMNFCRIFWEKRLDQFHSVKLDLAFKMTHFHVYIEYSNIELLPSF